MRRISNETDYPYFTQKKSYIQLGKIAYQYTVLFQWYILKSQKRIGHEHFYFTFGLCVLYIDDIIWFYRFYVFFCYVIYVSNSAQTWSILKIQNKVAKSVNVEWRLLEMSPAKLIANKFSSSDETYANIRNFIYVLKGNPWKQRANTYFLRHRVCFKCSFA